MTRRYLVKPAPTHGHEQRPNCNARSRFILLSRSYCHLCEDMLAALKLHGVAPQVIDVDIETQWLARWDELVPVLLLDGVEVFHYHVDEAKLASALQRMASDASEASDR